MRMTEIPKSKLEEHDKHLRGPEGFWFRLMHDDDLKDKLEDKYPFNTFVELLLWAIFGITLLSFILDLIVNAAQLWGMIR